jgi:hypothetical protein
MEPEVQKHKYLPVLVTVLVMLFVTAGAVAGVWYYMDKQAKKAADDNTQQAAELVSERTNNPEEPEILISDFENWKTYTDANYGFSFKHPANFSVEESEIKFFDYMGANCQQVNLIDESGLIVCDKEPNLTAYGLREPNGMDPVSDIDITIGGRPAKKYIGESSVSYIVLSPNNNRIELYADSLAGHAPFELLVSTFQFN